MEAIQPIVKASRGSGHARQLTLPGKHHKNISKSALIVRFSSKTALLRESMKNSPCKKTLYAGICTAYNPSGYAFGFDPTSRCHKREFLLKFTKDRRRWLQWLFEARRRYGKWTESIAVGSEPFIQNLKVLMGGMALGRKVLEAGGSFQLKEDQYPYIADFEPKKSDIGA